MLWMLADTDYSYRTIRVFSKLNFIAKWQLAEVTFKNEKNPQQSAGIWTPDLWHMTAVP